VVEGGFMTVYGTDGPTHVCLYAAEGAGDRPGYDGQGSFANFRAGDIDQVYRHLEEAGVTCSRIESGGPIRWFRFADPDGNRIDVCEYGPDWLS
jgi:catechol 2,3-dioxygenase-like lactoylglutathione lyase family enzyme